MVPEQVAAQIQPQGPDPAKLRPLPHNRKAAGADEIVNGLMKCGGEGMLTMMVMLYNWVWKNEYAPKSWREGVVVNLFKKRYKVYRGNYRGITL